MRARAWWTSLCLIAAAAACGDQPTEVVPERVQPVTGGPALAVASSDDGLSIATDKDDYAPGDTVWFTGAGWPANDVLDILLEDEPATHEPHRWTVATGEDGTFRDSTYVVDVGDLGVTFTLTATSQSTGRWLKVVFTDGVITFTSFTFFPGGSTSGSPPTGCTGVSGTSVASGTQICALGAFTVSGNGGTPVSIRWKNPSGTVVAVDARSPNFPNGTTGAQAFSSVFTPTVVGTWTALLCESSNLSITGGGANGCQGGPERGSATFTVTAAAVATTTQVTSSQNPSASGDEVTFTATVTSGSPATPVTTGQVSFKSGGTSCSDATELQAAQNVNTSGQVTFATSSLGMGSHVIWACYGGATGFLASEGSVTQQVSNTATDIDLVSSANPSKTGQSVTFTATVTNNSNPVTTGQVIFKTGGNDCSDATPVQSQGGPTPNSSGQVIYTATLAASQSPVTIWACYGGSPTPAPGLAASAASLTQVVQKAGTSTTVTSSPNPSVFSQSVTLQATVSVVLPGTGTPTGSVTFKDGTCAAGTVLGSASLDGGQASLSTAALDAGSHGIHACYVGDDDFEAGEGNFNHQVNQAQTTTAVTAVPTQSVFSQSVTFNVTVSAVSPAVATPVGTVTLKDGSCVGGTGLGSASLTSGVASFSTDLLAVGVHTITACYGGTSNFVASEGDVSHEVEKASTATAVTSMPNPSVFSQSVTFTVTVTPVSPAVATPDGNVTLKNGTCALGTDIGTSALDGSGEASFTTSTLGVGSHTITACYEGTGSFEASNEFVSQTVDKASTATAVTSSVNPSILAQPVTFTVTVTPVSPAVATPVGNVTLKDGSCGAGAGLGASVALDASGKASFTVSSLAAGNHAVTACYAGNASFKASDGYVTQQVTFNFVGFAPPVDRPNMYNLSKAGQAIPLKWELRDFFGNPVTTLTNVTVKVTDQGCSTIPNADQIEEYASGQSGLQNFGDGRYQFNWKTPGSYATSCKTLGLDIGEGSVRTNLAYFTFKK